MRHSEQYRLLMIPCNHAYIRNLKNHLEDIGAQVKLLKPFHYSAPFNIIKILISRFAGYRTIYVHWLYIFPSVWIMKLFCYYCHFLGLRIIWEMHNIVSHSSTLKDLRMSSWFYENCDGIVFHSYSDQEKAHQILNVREKAIKTVAYLPNFIDTYKNNISNEDARFKLNLPLDQRVLLCFGQIRKNRGYEYLLRAINGISDIVVVIAGEIIDKDTHGFLLSQASQDSRIKLFDKWISNEDIQLYFNACDVVILPYTMITTSGVLPLAYSFSKPVIVSEIGGIAEIVSKETGILIPPCDEHALRKAIMDILEMDYIQMGEKAYNYAYENLTWGKATKKISSFIKGMSG